MDTKCIYCVKSSVVEDCLTCSICNRNVHLKCLKRPGTPGDLVGDIFFEFKCINCTPDHKEVFVRKKLPWVLVIVLTLYNLSIQSKGLSHYGYFHWRTHIASFITKHWVVLFPPNFKPKKKWIGTISGTLSNNNPEYFVSGFDKINESGWWKLTYNQNTRFYSNMFENINQKKSFKYEKLERLVTEDINVVDLYPSDIEENNKRTKPEEVFSRTIPYMGRPQRVFPQQTSSRTTIDSHKTNTSSENDSESIHSNLTDFLANELSNSALLEEISNLNTVESLNPENNLFLDDEQINWNIGDLSNFDINNLPNLIKSEDGGEFASLLTTTTTPLSSTSKSIKQETSTDGGHGHNHLPLSSVENEMLKIFQAENETTTFMNHEYDGDDDEHDGTMIMTPRIIQVTNFQETDDLTSAAIDVHPELEMFFKAEPISDDDEDDNDGGVGGDDSTKRQKEKLVCEQSLFTVSRKREYPWKKSMEISEDKEENTSDDRILAMGDYNENLLHKKLKPIIENEFKNNANVEIPSWVRRLYRKLSVRQLKRSIRRPIFNFDEYSTSRGVRDTKATDSNILDRFYHLISTDGELQRKDKMSLQTRLAGSIQYDLFTSPYTGRILHPFIYRNTKCLPPWVRLMCELQYTVNDEYPERSTVDYCYVQPQHIAAVNGLLQKMFWPGIDMSECLSYPDFSIIALYKKLIIGCAFLVPDVGHSTAYVSFMAVRHGWQRCGIASFMLYHLIQTCMSKDITLHVSATNPAICLYQKFGFKIEEIVLDFYEKYLPIDSTDSRHALLLRMKR